MTCPSYINSFRRTAGHNMNQTSNACLLLNSTVQCPCKIGTRSHTNNVRVQCPTTIAARTGRNYFCVAGALWGESTGHKGQWRGTLKISLICAWTSDWANNQDVGDLRLHCAHYDVMELAMANIQARWHKTSNCKSKGHIGQGVTGQNRRI